jgi:hypothetical protein
MLVVQGAEQGEAGERLRLQAISSPIGRVLFSHRVRVSYGSFSGALLPQREGCPLLAASRFSGPAGRPFFGIRGGMSRLEV